MEKRGVEGFDSFKKYNLKGSMLHYQQYHGSIWD
jgi:hypothetical protein